MEYKYKIGVIRSDMGGCWHYRIYQPFKELRRFGVDMEHTVFLPHRLGEDQLDTLVRWVEQFDLIIVQRCFRYDIFQRVKLACTITGRKLIFESDDLYNFLPDYNPCSAEMRVPGALDGFLQILREADYVTVTTQEIKDAYYLYNRNIKVIPNNVETVSMFKDEFIHNVGPDGQIPVTDHYGLITHPTVANVAPEGQPPRYEKLIRIGYSATPTHRYDYLQIKPALEKYFEDFPNSIMFYMGDPWFVENHPANHKNKVFIPTMPQDLYFQNLRNFDFGIAPLVPDIFNMGKSPLKLLEYAAWGIPAVAPNYITYTREFTHEKNALFYRNNQEMLEMMTRMTTDHQLRAQLGYNAAVHVHNHRTEKVNAEERFNFYKEIIDSTPKHPRFVPGGTK